MVYPYNRILLSARRKEPSIKKEAEETYVLMTRGKKPT